MKVVILRSNPVDPDPRVEKAVNGLMKEGFKVEVLAWDRSANYMLKDSFLELEAGRAKIYRFGIHATFGGGMRRNLIPLLVFQVKLYRWLYENRNSYNIIHACDFDTAYVASLVAKKFNKKLVYDIFDYYVDSFRVPTVLKRFVEQKDHAIINSADATIICTEKRKEQINGTEPRILSVIHNSPAQLESHIPKLALAPSRIKIVYVGILADGRFLKEIAEIVKSKQIYEFHVGGFGQLATYFEALAKAHNNIIFYGKLPYKKTLELENSCDIMVALYDPSVPNHSYAAPNKFYEALMLGKPIIMVRNTGMDEVIYKNHFGEVIEFTAKSLETAIASLVRRKSEWPTMAVNMKRLYKEEYSWSKMEERLRNLYLEMLK